jgi:hypothetical protein
MMRGRYLFPVLNTVGFILVLALNAMANAVPINGMTTGEVSAAYENLFVPAGLTFSIWGLIYVLLGFFVAYEWVVARDDRDLFSDKIGPWFFVSCLANAAWILAWHYERLPLSFLLMLVLLCSLLAIYLRLGIGVTGVARSERILVHVPFSVYLGWISVATIANVSALLTSVQWSTWGLGAQFWTVAVLTIATLLALTMALRRYDVFFALVVDWALLGILLKRLGDTAAADRTIEVTAVTGIVLISAAVAMQIVRRRVYRPAVM